MMLMMQMFLYRQVRWYPNPWVHAYHTDRKGCSGGRGTSQVHGPSDSGGLLPMFPDLLQSGLWADRTTRSPESYCNTGPSGIDPNTLRWEMRMKEKKRCELPGLIVLQLLDIHGFYTFAPWPYWPTTCAAHLSAFPVRWGFRSRSASCFLQSRLSECALDSLPRQCIPRVRPTGSYLRPGRAYESSGVTLSYTCPNIPISGRIAAVFGWVRLSTLISPYGFGLVSFRVWMLVRTSRPDGRTPSRGFSPTLLGR